MIPPLSAVFPLRKPIQTFPHTVPVRVAESVNTLPRQAELPGAVDQAVFSLLPNDEEADTQRAKAEKYKERGNRYRKLQMPDQAISAYLKAVAVDPEYTDAYYNLAKTYLTLGEKQKAIDAYKSLLAVDPSDHDARAALAEEYRNEGKYAEAKSQYAYILSYDPHFDPALSNLAYLNLLSLTQVSPSLANAWLQNVGAANLAKAKSLLSDYYTQSDQPDMIDVMNRVKYQFAHTQTIRQIQNMAEYDNDLDLIRLRPEMAFSFPNVLGAYLAHELVHAKDGDGLTSIREEQDGYRALEDFWSLYKQGVESPNLDLAVSLYEESPDSLDSKVESLYLMRDPLMPATSPGHGMPLGTADLKDYSRFDVTV